MPFKWEKTLITDAKGRKVEASTPFIITASRSTDIPAFYGEWFRRRLDAGYVKWVNPFNGAPYYVSFAKTRFFVFWTKNPRPFLPVLEKVAEMGYGFYFQFTLNNYDGTGLEPGLPPLDERIDAFTELSRRYGKERTVWRYDPLILTASTGMDELLARVRAVGDKIHPYTEKLVFSFCEIGRYPKVVRNLARERINYTVFDGETMIHAARRIAEMNREWGLTVASCAQEIGLGEYGISHNKCVDDELIARISPDDTALAGFLGRGNGKEFKDKGQRKFCRCIPSKDIGQYDTCPHFCAYCYANTSRESVRRKSGKYSPESEGIIST
jgi:hypothetical protein